MANAVTRKAGAWLAYGLACCLTCGCATHSDERLIKDEISRGLAERFHTMSIPIGDVEIMSGLSSQMENSDAAHKRFKAEYLEFLKYLDSKRLVNLTEQSQTGLDAIRRMGARTITITPTEKALAARDAKLSSSDYLMLPMGSCSVDEIIRAAPYQAAQLSRAEEYRLVLGTYRLTLNRFGESLDSSAKPAKHRFRFRAVLRFDPFAKRYTFQYADWGDLEKDDWATHNVE